MMDLLSGLKQVFVQQKKEWGEVFTGLEFKNKYAIYDQDENHILFAAEVAGSFFARFFLRNMRPFTIHILDKNGQLFLKIVRPFRWIFSECDILDANDQKIGTVKWEFSILRKKFVVLDESGMELYKLFAPILKPWTFQIKKNDEELGKITKRWSGLFKEAVTTADNFTAIFPNIASAKEKAILLGAVFLIDFVYFEKNN